MDSQGHRTDRHFLGGKLLLLLALALVCWIFFPAQSQALSTESVTAKPNDASTTKVIGGEETRITWNGIVGDKEEVSSITLVFPQGTMFSDSSYVQVQEGIRDDPEHVRPSTPKSTMTLATEQLRLDFAVPIHSKSQLRIQIYGVSLPAKSDDYYVVGSYVDGKGVTHALAEQEKPIKAIVPTLTDNLVAYFDGLDWVKSWNSVKFLNIFLNPGWAVASVSTLFPGWLVSLLLVLLGFPLAIPIGLGISFLRMSKFSIIRGLSGVYVNVIRGTPLFLQIYLAFLGLPLLGVNITPYLLSIIVLALNSSAYLAEIFRAGIQSINKGQFEAASSLGMNGFQTMFSVIIPQTIRRVIPTMTSEFILLYKDTSLLSAVGVMEQMMFAKNLAASTGILTPYVVAGCFYLVITLPMTRVITVFEKRLAASEGRSVPPEEKKKKKRVGLFNTVDPGAMSAAKPDGSMSAAATASSAPGVDVASPDALTPPDALTLTPSQGMPPDKNNKKRGRREKT
ncbi:MAG: amino acid ABC transporter permease [Actinomycetia bacterium]|nr:amino acid ABC transporter permease [Actinomycetes bacterium]